METEDFKNLKACPYCAPVRRKADIDEANREMGLDPEAIAAAREAERAEERAAEPTVYITMNDMDTEDVSIVITGGE